MIPDFFCVSRLDSTNSTNMVAKEAAANGVADGYTVFALEQTAGKGRQGRTWESPKGNLYVSVVFRPQCPSTDVCYYSFVGAMAVFGAIRDLCGDDKMQLKWPNDVLVDGKKISGILVETEINEQGLVDWVVLGVGINVVSHPETALYPTTCLSKEGANPSIDKVLEAFLLNLDHWRLTLRHDGFGPIRRAWLADAKTGPMVVKLPQETIEGTFAGLDPFGGLILRLANGTERVIQAGDVFT